MRDGHSLVDLILLFVGENTLGGTARRGAPGHQGSDGGERGGRSGIYCPLVSVSILDAPPTPRRCVR